MSFYLIIAFVILAIYGTMLVIFGLGFLRTVSSDSVAGQLHSFTIIICARNEEKYIVRCLRSIIEQNYDRDLIEIILVNDAGTDSTVTLAGAILKQSGLKHRVITLPLHRGKKAGITCAMQYASHEIILERDADTYTKSNNWLRSINAEFIRNDSDLVIGPIAISDNTGSLWALQAIESNILQVFACGSAYYRKAFLCSGANLAFKASLFELTNGYTSHAGIASGDDVLFMEEAKQKGAKITYLKSTEGVVYTYPCYSFSSLMAQKIRWASKFKVNPNKLNSAIAMIVFFTNLSWLSLLIFGFADPLQGELCLIFVSLKLIFDILLLFLAAGFIKNRGLLWYSIPVGFIYPVYSVLVSILSVFKKPAWKP